MAKEIEVIEIEKDLDNDRFITYEDFCALLRFLPMYSKSQCYYLLMGITGFRPIEVTRLTLAQLDFSDVDKPLIVNRITKTKKKWYYDEQGRVKATKIIKVKRRIIPLWVKEYLENYIRLHYNKFNPDEKGSFYLFSRPKHSGFISSACWRTDVSKLRKQLLNHDPVKWAWVKEPAYWKCVMGKKVPVYRLSNYAFRKSRSTWYGMELMHKGVSDVLLCVSQFMGHAKLNTTYTYLKSLRRHRSMRTNRKNDEKDSALVVSSIGKEVTMDELV